MLILLLYGGMLHGMLPGQRGISWISSDLRSPSLTAGADGSEGAAHVDGFFRTAQNDHFQGTVAAQFALDELDEETVVTGSANLSIFSMQKAVELDLVVRENPGFVDAVKRAMEHRTGEGELVAGYRKLKGYNRFLARLQDLHQKVVG